MTRKESDAKRGRTRREFLGDVGRGMIVASVGAGLAGDLGIGSAWASEEGSVLRFGALEPLVAALEDTPVSRLQPFLAKKLQGGTELKTLVAAAALANARSFGGQNYVGYHAAMALMPAYAMSKQLPESEAALPVLKVLHRNTHTIQKEGSPKILRKIAVAHGASVPTVQDLRNAVRKQDMDRSEQYFARMTKEELERAYNDLQAIVQDGVNVHRTVLAWRAWDLLQLTGMEHAHTLLRQSVRFCVDHERTRVRRGQAEPRIRKVLPRILSEHKLLERSFGTKGASDEAIDELWRTIYCSDSDTAASAVAAALADGCSPQVVGEAISIAANELVLHDRGKSGGKVHGASNGVHASDAVNAWRSIAGATDHRNAMASLVVAAYHTAGRRGGTHKSPYPFKEHKQRVRCTEPAQLLAELDEAIQGRDQGRAVAVVERYSKLSQSAEPVFARLLRYAISEDGALHAEKYYCTVREEFARTRECFRWRHLMGLARVTASQFGEPAPGVAEARTLIASRRVSF